MKKKLLLFLLMIFLAMPVSAKTFGTITANGDFTALENIISSNLGIEFTESDSNPSCASGDFKIFADLSELALKQCVDGVTTDVGAGAGDITDVGPAFSTGAAFVDGIASSGTDMLIWEGTAVDGNELRLISPTDNPGSDINITLPAATGTLVTATENIATATALAANPDDCSANQFAQSIIANGNLTCAAIVDADVPNNITIDLAATATALAANGGNCSAGSYPLGVDASGAVESCTDATTEIDSAISTHAGISAAHHAPGGGGGVTGNLSKTIEIPGAGNNFLLTKSVTARTISAIHCLVDPADSAETVTIDINECNSNGDSCVSILTSPVVCANTNTTASISDSAIAANAYMDLDIDAVVGSVDQVIVTIIYTE